MKGLLLFLSCPPVFLCGWSVGQSSLVLVFWTHLSDIVGYCITWIHVRPAVDVYKQSSDGICCHLVILDNVYIPVYKQVNIHTSTSLYMEIIVKLGF